jgi:hypothetical protein
MAREPIGGATRRCPAMLSMLCASRSPNFADERRKRVDCVRPAATTGGNDGLRLFPIWRRAGGATGQGTHDHLELARDPQRVHRPMHSSMSRIWDDVNDDPDVHVVVLIGAGRAFSAGGRPCCTDRSLGGADWTVYQGPFLTTLGSHRAIQSQPRPPSSHPEAAAQSDELGCL